MYITQADLLPPIIIPRRKKRLKQLRLEFEKEAVGFECFNYVRSFVYCFVHDIIVVCVCV